MIILVNITPFLLIPAKFATSGLLQITQFERKGYDVRALSRVSNFVIDEVMRPKFDYYSISIKEGLPNLIL